MSKHFRILLTAGAALLAACGSEPARPPETPLQHAQNVVARAEEARVGDFAHEDMSNAREHLAAARAAPGERQIRQLADEAIADAELATAKAQYARIQAASFTIQEQLGLVQQAPAETMMPVPDTVPDAPPDLDTQPSSQQYMSPAVTVPAPAAGPGGAP